MATVEVAFSIVYLDRLVEFGGLVLASTLLGGNP